jgi:phosphoenolpyruvate synthase/pyruvate phosphate dikinase
MTKLATKADTLQLLYQKLNNAKVLPQFTFRVGDWKNKKKDIINDFSKIEWNDKIIVRSSSLSEDTSTQSEAGKYESVANVSGANDFQKAVETVINSYDDDNEANQILIQPMLSNVQICGVAFTLDPNTLGNYYVVNYNENGSTSAVTSGQGGSNKLYYRFKSMTIDFPKNNTPPKYGQAL